MYPGNCYGNGAARPYRPFSRLDSQVRHLEYLLKQKDNDYCIMKAKCEQAQRSLMMARREVDDQKRSDEERLHSKTMAMRLVKAELAQVRKKLASGYPDNVSLQAQLASQKDVNEALRGELSHLSHQKFFFESQVEALLRERDMLRTENECLKIAAGVKVRRERELALERRQRKRQRSRQRPGRPDDDDDVDSQQRGRFASTAPAGMPLLLDDQHSDAFFVPRRRRKKGTFGSGLDVSMPTIAVPRPPKRRGDEDGQMQVDADDTDSDVVMHDGSGPDASFGITRRVRRRVEIVHDSLSSGFYGPPPVAEASAVNAPFRRPSMPVQMLMDYPFLGKKRRRFMRPGDVTGRDRERAQARAQAQSRSGSGSRHSNSPPSHSPLPTPPPAAAAAAAAPSSPARPRPRPPPPTAAANSDDVMMDDDDADGVRVHLGLLRRPARPTRVYSRSMNDDGPFEVLPDPIRPADVPGW